MSKESKISISGNTNFFLNKIYIFYLIIILFSHINILIQSILFFLLILIFTILVSLDQFLKNFQKGNIMTIKNLIFINILFSCSLELVSFNLNFNNYKFFFQTLNIDFIYLYKSYLFFLYFNFILLIFSNLKYITKKENEINLNINEAINYYANKKNLYLFFLIVIFLFTYAYLVNYFGFRNLSTNYDLDIKKKLFFMFVQSLPIILGIIIFKNKFYINKLFAFLIFSLVILYFFNFGRREIFYSFLLLFIAHIYLKNIKINFQFIFKNLINFFFIVFFFILLFYLFEIYREDKQIISSLYSSSDLFENISKRTRKFFIFAELYSYKIQNFYPYHLLSNLIYSIPEIFISNKMNYISQEEIMNIIFGTDYKDVNFYNELAAFNDFNIFGVVAYPILIILFWLILINIINFLFNIHPYNSKYLILILVTSNIFFYFLSYGESYNFIVSFRDIIIIFIIYFIITFSQNILKRTMKLK